MEEKHENKPSKRQRVKYDESLHLLNSASKWDSVYLQRFGVEFERAEYTPLNTLITDAKWYDPDQEPTEGFAQGYIPVYLTLNS